MVLRKSTIDNSVNYIHSANTSPSENSYDHIAKIISNPRKPNEKLSQKNKKFIMNLTEECLK